MITTEQKVMDSRRIAVVKESFTKVRPYSGKFTRVLFSHLFELHPNLRDYFPKDMRGQRRRFMAGLIFIIENLHDATVIHSKLKELAVVHITYGIKKEDYDVFGDALIFALSAALGDDFTDSVKSTWRDVYNTIAQLIIEEANK